MSAIADIITKYSSMFGVAAVTTLLLSVFTVLFSFIIGSLLAVMKISSIKPLRWLANIYVEFIRGTPLLVQVYVVFYGLPLLGVSVPSFDLLGNDFSRLFAGIIALVVNSSAYVCEIVRGGILSIDSGQMEAARSIGFSKTQSMLLIIFPQTIKNILPSLGNEFVSVIKNSSQVSVIGVAELMYTTNTIRSISFRSFEPLIVVSVIYFIMTFIISSVIKRFEMRLAVSDRK